MKFKELVKYILFPLYRRSILALKYVENGCSHKEALAKVKVIEGGGRN